MLVSAGAGAPEGAGDAGVTQAAVMVAKSMIRTINRVKQGVFFIAIAFCTVSLSTGKK